MVRLRKPEANYTIVTNELLRDKRLSLKAKGLYALLFSKPDDWEYHEAPLIEESADGKESFRSGILELVEAGWLVKRQPRNEDGTLGHLEWWLSSGGTTVAGKPVDGQSASTKTDITKTDEVIPHESPNRRTVRRGQSPSTRLEEFLSNTGGEPPSNFGEYASGLGWSPDFAGRVWERFCRYWRSPDAKGGGRKRDWRSTWQNWCDKRLGVTVTRYFMASHLPQSQWKDHKGIIVKKSAVLNGRAAARRVAKLMNEGKLK